VDEGAVDEGDGDGDVGEDFVAVDIGIVLPADWSS
jgi:hypothetical protein